MRRRPPPRLSPELWEIITPRTNRTPISALARLLTASAVPAPFSLELAGTAGGRRFLLRAGPRAMAQLTQQLDAAYPQAERRQVGPAGAPGQDPAAVGADEQVAVCALVLRAAPYLPLRTFRDTELGAERTPQADPILGLLGALGGLPRGWRAMSQLVLHPAPPDWSAPYQRLALEHPLAAERALGQ